MQAENESHGIEILTPLTLKRPLHPRIRVRRSFETLELAKLDWRSMS